MFKYYDFVKSKYNIEPKINFSDEIIDGVKVYIHKATCCLLYTSDAADE